MKVVVAISGASGSIYGIRFLEACQCEKTLVVSEGAKEIMLHETGKNFDEKSSH